MSFPLQTSLELQRESWAAVTFGTSAAHCHADRSADGLDAERVSTATAPGTSPRQSVPLSHNASLSRFRCCQQTRSCRRSRSVARRLNTSVDSRLLLSLLHAGDDLLRNDLCR